LWYKFLGGVGTTGEIYRCGGRLRDSLVTTFKKTERGKEGCVGGDPNPVDGYNNPGTSVDYAALI
jgi:hypothetical protein